MKKTLIAAVVAGAIGVTVPQVAEAGGNWYAYSGHRGHSYGFSYQSRGHGSHKRYGHQAPRGHYEYRTQKVWVPGGWHYYTDECGRTSRVYKNGRYEHQKVKVWVPYRAHHTTHTSYRRPYCRY
jgi:hypothetical protein